MRGETMKLPAFAQEDYYLNKKADEANEKAELFKQATSCGKTEFLVRSIKYAGRTVRPLTMKLVGRHGQD